MKGLTGKTAIVTGASSGIGQAIAIRLGAEGCHVVINYRSDAEGAETTAQQAQQGAKAAGHDIQTLTVQADVSQEADIQHLFEQATHAWGHVDIVINNAGIQIEASSHQVSTDDFDKVINVNLRGAYLCSREAIQQFFAAVQTGCHYQCIERPRGDPPSPIHQLFHEQGGHGQPDPHPGAGICSGGHPGQRDRTGGDRNPHQRKLG